MIKALRLNSGPITLAICLIPFLFSNALLAAPACAPISKTTADRLSRYVYQKFQFPPVTMIELASSETVQGSCYRKLVFHRHDDPFTQIVLFLSPDHRFLFREVLDSAVDIAEQRRNEQRRLEAERMTGQLPTKGATDAPATVVLFSDFQCPYCKMQTQVLKHEFAESDVRIVFRNLPLPIHPWAKIAAEMASCVHQQSNDAFRDLHDWFFSNQEKLTPANVKGSTENILEARTDIDLRKYEACLAGGEAVAQVERDIRFAHEHNIHATPTMFINGAPLEGVIKADDIRALIGRAKSNLIK
jgi:protein-disulfide isomerase